MHRLAFLLALLALLLAPAPAAAQLETILFNGTFSTSQLSTTLYLGASPHGFLLVWVRGTGTHDSRLNAFITHPVTGVDQNVDDLTSTRTGANVTDCVYLYNEVVTPVAVPTAVTGSNQCDLISTRTWGVFQSFKIELTDVGAMASAVNTVYLVQLQ